MTCDVSIFVFQSLILSKRSVDDSMKASVVNFDLETDYPEELLETLLESEKVLVRVSYNHAITSAASTGSQMLAMSIFLEGKSGNVLCY